ncbi:TonB-dependent receptor family protein [Parachryseolinea silvisoli]|uniref:TonB-dependent receptor family protein n=1 Tax=Parachryseolinea silvisoli TaxID=2873601 RepID=UPI002265A9F9|nr:TonB-dependent receptor [Parachryseolinea silvisoli]MCD9019403.1 TonB-dependent receptor [Parachryseolinea silvisoli]
MTRLFTAIVFMASISAGFAQTDSLKIKQLKEVVIQSNRYEVERLPATQGTYLLGGRKNEVLNIQQMNVNIAEKTPRQIFAKVPGVFVYDMDGTGNQTNISTRGLDPHRGWEYNIRKNGIITNSDMYGYPASHYSMPMEAVERIEMIRGTGSLQYGAQFGGMLNYVSKHPDTTRVAAYETINTVGSFGLFSTYHALSGTVGKFQYYVYYNKRKSDGYRDNSDSDFDAQSFMLAYRPTDRMTIKAEVARSKYIYHIPGPLTDSMFHADPRQSTRARNYFNPAIYVPSLSLDWKLSDRTRLSWVLSAVLGERNSVQLDKLATTKDVIDPNTLTYASRQVDIDNFNSYTSELRLLHTYTLGKTEHVVVAGVQLFNNDLHRRQLGKGTTGADFDLSLIDPNWGRDLHFKTNNVAVFVENAFRLLPGLSITPGVRVEMGESKMSGTISYYDAGSFPDNIDHTFALGGLNIDYITRKGNNVYAGFSQAYRPVIFKDIIPASAYETIDKDLKDATGYNMELGYRGITHGLRWDIGVFSLGYDNRLGTLEQTNPDNGTTYIYRTNIGNSMTTGAEIFLAYNLRLGDYSNLSLFTSTAFFHARYTDAIVRSGKNAGGSAQSENIDIRGNKVETVPDMITRNGITFYWHRLSATALYSYTGESYADPLNTVTPSKTGAVGLVPSYGLLDFNASFRVTQQWMVRVNMNNMTDKQYFTKRPSFYPGPGVWSSDGRSMNVTVALKV